MTCLQTPTVGKGRANYRGSSSIGLATARLPIQETGEHVIITGRRQPELDGAQNELGPMSTAVRGDVASLSDQDTQFRILAEPAQSLDIVFAKAPRQGVSAR